MSDGPDAGAGFDRSPDAVGGRPGEWLKNLVEQPPRQVFYICPSPAVKITHRGLIPVQIIERDIVTIC